MALRMTLPLGNHALVCSWAYLGLCSCHLLTPLQLERPPLHHGDYNNHHYHHGDYYNHYDHCDDYYNHHY